MLKATKYLIIVALWGLLIWTLWPVVHEPRIDIAQVKIPELTQSTPEVPTQDKDKDSGFTLREDSDAQELRLLFQTGAYEKALKLANALSARMENTTAFAQWIKDQMPGILLSAGWLRIQSLRYEDAIPLLMRAQKLKPTKEGSKGLSYCYYQLKQTGTALQHLDDYLRVAPHDISMLTIRADALESESRFIEAAAALDKISKLGSTNKQLDARSQSLLARAKQSVNQSVYSTVNFHVTYLAPNHDDIITDVVDILELAADEFVESYGFRPLDTAIEVILYADRDFKKAVQYGPEWAQGLFDGRIRIPVNADHAGTHEGSYLRRVLRHELVHAMLSDMTAGRKGLPSWFNEGLAQRLECSSDCSISRPSPNRGSFLATSMFETNYTEFSADVARQSYEQSLYLIRTLEKSPSHPDALRRVITPLSRTGASVDSDNLLRPLGYTFENLRNLAAKTWANQK